MGMLQRGVEAPSLQAAGGTVCWGSSCAMSCLLLAVNIGIAALGCLLFCADCTETQVPDRDNIVGADYL